MINEDLFGAALLLGAFFYDILIGERPLRTHFAIISGKILSFFDKKTNRKNSRRKLIILGILPIIATTLLAFSICTLLHYVAHYINYLHLGILITFIVGLYILKTSFAIRSMGECIAPIIKSLKEENIDEARKNVSYIVSRPTDELEEEEVLSAAFECVGESIVDGIISPLTYYLFFGIFGALAYRGVNTADSMIGYRTPRYEHYGKFAAKLDDVLNFIPTRIAIVFTFGAAAIMRLDLRHGIRTMNRYGHVTDSPNAGLTMSLYAGLFHVHVEKKGYYSLGSDKSYPSIETVERSLKLMNLSAILFIITCIILMLILPLPFVLV